MRFPSMLLSVVLSVAATGVFAQSVNVTVGDPPIVMRDVESALALITITETTPDALQDGYFTLLHDETPDSQLQFTANSSVGGSATSIAFSHSVAGMGATIAVDADDSRIDTITVQLHAVVEFGPLKNPPIVLMLGEHPLLIPEGGMPTGLGPLQFLTVGTYGGSCCITIGDSATLELAVGESATLPLVHEHAGYVEVDSFQPGIASVGTVTVNSAEIIGVSPGTALIQAWNPLGQAGYLTVTVTGPDIPAQEQLTLLIDEVEALVPTVLKHGQAQAVTSKLRAARSAIERGNTNAALGQLNALENLVHAHRHIDPDQADEILGAIAAIVANLDA